jgi:hypothetical protein
MSTTFYGTPWVAEHRAHAHEFIDMLFDDDEADRAARNAQAATKVIPLQPRA